jgi:hypothetical protein
LLFSGGLDSILVAKIFKREKIRVIPVCFKSYFFDCRLAKKSAKKLRLKLKVIDFSKEHLSIVKNPKYGYGKRMNPCIDCHLLMLKKARKIMKDKNLDFIATGDVLGERPFSQNREVLMKAEREVNLEGLILRPLSAKLFPETIPEKKRIIKREKMFDFKGRSRRSQLKLAKKLRTLNFPNPAGGCILTNLEYSKKLKELFKKVPDCNGKDCQILKKGRTFWIPPTDGAFRFTKAPRVSIHHQDKFLIIVGRNKKENRELKRFKKARDIILEPENFPGPTVLVRGFGRRLPAIQIKRRAIQGAVEFLLNYSKKIPEIIKISLDEI